MAQIGVNTMHKWATGEVVTADNMNVNQDILRTAINDTDTRVTNLNIFGIAAGNIVASLTGSLLDPNKMTFKRDSTAYGKDGTLYPLGTLRTAQGKYGQGAFMEELTYNILVPNQSNIETDLTGLLMATNTGNKGVLTRTTEDAWEGSASAKIVTSGYTVGDDISFSTTESLGAIAVFSDNTYTASVYVKAFNGVTSQLRIIEWNSIGTVVRDTPISQPSVGDGTWQRMSLTVKTQPTTERISIRVAFYGNGTFYVDALQLEQKPYATSFITGNQSRQPEFLSYTLPQPLPSKHFGFITWKPEQSATAPALNDTRALAVGYYETNDYRSTYRQYVFYRPSDKTIKFISHDPVSDETYIVSSSAINFNELDQVVVGWKEDAQNGAIFLWVGINGGVFTEYNAVRSTTPTDTNRFYIGCDAVSGYEANGTIDWPIVSDTVPTDEQVEALYRAAEIGGNRHFPNPTQLLNQQAWGAPTLVNGWVNFATDYETVAYMKDSLGFVHLKGTIKNGTTTSGTVLFTLPVGFRPKNRLPFDTDSNGFYGRVDILPTGEVLLILGSNTSTSLNISSFRAEQ